jgi:hypothetical protein
MGLTVESPSLKRSIRSAPFVGHGGTVVPTVILLHLHRKSVFVVGEKSLLLYGDTFFNVVIGASMRFRASAAAAVA